MLGFHQHELLGERGNAKLIVNYKFCFCLFSDTVVVIFLLITVRLWVIEFHILHCLQTYLDSLCPLCFKNYVSVAVRVPYITLFPVMACGISNRKSTFSYVNFSLILFIPFISNCRYSFGDNLVYFLFYIQQRLMCLILMAFPLYSTWYCINTLVVTKLVIDKNTSDYVLRIPSPLCYIIC